MNRIKKYEPLWGSWYVEDKVGEGSYGAVYRVVRKSRNKAYRAAVKLISIPKTDAEIRAQKRKKMTDAAIQSLYEKKVDRLEQEIMLMAEMQGASNIVTIQDFMIRPHVDKDGNETIGYDVLIRMEYLQNLEEYLIDHQPDVREVITMGINLCKALEHCEKKRIIHRDIKPENIFRNEFGEYKIGDFGISRQMDHTSKATSAGTPLYMAPEIMFYQPYNHTVDIYAVGLMMYQILNHNRLPFMPDYPEEIWPEDSEVAVQERLQGTPFPRLKGIPENLEKIIIKATAFHKEDRYINATEMRWNLENALRELDEGKPVDRAVPEDAEADKKDEQVSLEENFPEDEDRNEGFLSEEAEQDRAEYDYPEEADAPEFEAGQTSQEDWEEEEAYDRAAPAPVLEVGSVCSFGVYPQVYGSDEKVPLEWVILDKQEDRMLMITRKALVFRPYNMEMSEVTWEKSSIRTWLNDTFYQNAFSQEERGEILSTLVKADRNPRFMNNPGEDSRDHVFLLSVPEAAQYFKTENEMKCQATEYALSQAADVTDSLSEEGTCFWWLRTPGYDGRSAAGIYKDGGIFYGGMSVSMNYGAVRPAIWVMAEE